VTGSPWWVVLLAAALGAGVLQTLGAGIKLLFHWRRTSTPEKIEQQKIHDQVAQADQSIMVVSRSRDALELDNVRLRQEIAERVARHAEDIRRHEVERVEWREERAELRREIDAMEARLQKALDEVQALKQRHGMG
jgi:phage shock protein A